MKFSRNILALLFAMLVPCLSRGTNIPIFPQGPVTQLNNLVWGSSGPLGFNNNFFFTPANLQESVCVYVINNNPTNPHPFTASIVVNGDPLNATPSDPTWQSAVSSVSLNANNSPGFPASFGSNISGVAQVSINLSASTTLAGSPDTASIRIVQTTGTCFAGTQTINGSSPPLFVPPAIQNISDGLGTAFIGSQTFTNPAAAAQLLQVNGGGPSASKNVYFDRVVISASAAASLNIQGTGSLGSSCVIGATLSNEKIPTVVTSVTQLNSGCTVLPGVSGAPIPVLVPAGTTLTVDLRGIIIAAPTTTGGLEIINNTAIASGTVAVTFFWYEK